MTDPDLRNLAALWQHSDGTEQELTADLVRKAKLKARLLGYADLALAVLLVTATVLGVLLKPGVPTAIFALLLIAATLWLGWKRRGLRQMALTLDATDRHSFIESAVKLATANLRRVSLSLYVLPLFIALPILFKLSYRHGGHPDLILAALGDLAVSTRGMVIAGLVAIAVAALIRSRRRIRAELGRLDALQRTYRDEAILDDQVG